MEIFAVFGRIALEGAEAADAAMNRLGQNAESLGQRVSRFGSSVAGIGASLTTGVTLPIIGAFGAAAASAVGFESSLAKIQGLVGVAADEVAAMGDQIMRLAPTVGQGPAELADALFFVTSAGLRGSEAMEVLEMSAKAAAAGLGETTTVADLVTSAMNAYGSDALSATQATDILTNAVRQGKAEPAELAASMGQVLPIAAELGVSFDQVAAAQAAMTRTGTNASQAGTQLRQIMATLLNPTAQARDQLEEMGLSAQGLREQVREEGLLSTLQTLREATNQYGEDAMSKVFPNIRALTGVLDLMGENAEDNIAIFDELSDSTGVLDEAFEAASQTTGFRLRQALATVKTLLTDLGMTVLSVVTPAIEFLVAVLGRVTDFWLNLSDRMQRAVVIFGLVAAAVGPVLWVIGQLIVVFGMLLNPLGLVAIAIGLLVAAFTTNFLGIRDIVLGVWNTVAGVIGNFEDAIQSFREAFRGEWVDNENIMRLHRLAGMFGIVAGAIWSLINGDWNTFYRLALNAPDWLQPLLFGLDTLVGIVQRIAGAFRDEGFIGGLRQIGEEIPRLLSLLGELATHVREHLVEAFHNIDWQAVGDLVWDGIVAAITAVTDVASRIYTWVSEQVSSIVWRDVGQAMWDNLVESINAAITAGAFVLDLAGKLFNFILDEINENVDWEAVGNAISDGLSSAWDFVTYATEKFDEWLRESLKLPEEGPIWSELGKALGEALKKLWDYVDASTEEFDAWLRESIGAPEEGSPLEEGLGKQISDLLKGAWDHVESATDQFDAWLRNAIGAPETGNAFTEEMFERIPQWIQNVDWFSLGERLGEKLVEWVTSAFGWVETNITDPFDEWLRNLLAGDGDDSEAGTNFGKRLLDAIWFGIQWLFSMIYVIIEAFVEFFAGLFTPILSSIYDWGKRVLGEFFSGLVDSLEEWGEETEARLIAWFVGLWESIDEKNEEWKARFIAFWAGVWESINETSDEWRERLIAWFVGLWESVDEKNEEWKERFIAFWVGVWESINEKSEEWRQRLIDWFVNLWDAIVETVIEWKDAVIGFVEELYTDVTTWFSELYTDVTTSVSELVTDVIEFFQQLYDDSIGFVDDLVTGVIEFFVNLYNDVTTSVGDLVTEVVGFFVQLKDDVVAAVVELVGDVVAEAAALPGKVLAAVGDLSNLLVEAGKDVLRGFLSGLSDAVLNNSITTKIGEIASPGIGLANRVLRRESPSKVFIEMGRDIMEGLIIGLGDKDHELLQTIASTVNSIIGMFDNILNFIGRLPEFEFSAFDLWTEELENKFIRIMSSAIGTVNEVASRWDTEVAEELAEFAGHVKAIFDPLIAALDFVERLQESVFLDYDQWNRTLEWRFIQLLDGVLRTFNWVREYWGLTLTAEIDAVAGNFSNMFTPLVEALGLVEALSDSTLNSYDAWSRTLEWRFIQLLDGVLRTFNWVREHWGFELTAQVSAVAELFVGMFGPLLDAVSLVDALTESTLSEYDGWSRTLEWRFIQMMDGVLRVFNWVRNHWNQEILASVGATADAIKGIFGPLQEAIGFLNAIQDTTLSDFNAWTTGLQNGLKRLLNDVTSLMYQFARNWEMQALNAASDAANAISGVFGPFQDALGFITNLRDVTLSDFSRWNASLESRLTQLIYDVTTTMERFAQRWETETLESVSDAAAALSNIFGPFSNALSFINGLNEDTHKNFRYFSRRLSDMLTSLVAIMVGVMRQFARRWDTSVLNAVSETASKLSNLFAPFNNAISFLKSLQDLTEGDFREFSRKLHDHLVAFVDEAISILESFADRGVKDTVESSMQLFEKLIDLLTSMPDDIRAAFSNADKILYNAGRAIVRGLIEGMQSMFDPLIHTAQSMGELIQANKGPIEVDRQLLRPQAAAIMSGLINELISHKPQLESAMQSITDTIGNTQVQVPPMSVAGMDAEVSTSGVASSDPSLMSALMELANQHRHPSQISVQFYDGAVQVHGTDVDAEELGQRIAEAIDTVVDEFIISAEMTKPGARSKLPGVR